MLLSVSVDDINKWVSLFANVATCITALTAIGALVSAIIYFKNRPTNKTFQISLKVLRSDEFTENGNIFSRLLCSLDICNFTDKEFSIIECNLVYNKHRSIMQEKHYLIKGSLYDFRPLKNISLDAHQSTTLSSIYFEVPNLTNNKALLEVKTTQKTLVYKVNLEEQGF